MADELCTTSYCIQYGTKGTFGTAKTFAPNRGLPGLWIEGTSTNGGPNGESGGIFMNDNTFCLWSPGDQDILRVYDEDKFNSGPMMSVSNMGQVTAKALSIEEGVSFKNLETAPSNIRTVGLVMDPATGKLYLKA